MVWTGKKKEGAKIMYTRGQFAVIGNIGRKALRLYEEEGILVPFFVNQENGYHYYAMEQLAELEKIKRYRKIGISLFEIKQILSGKASEEEIMGNKLAELDMKLSEIKNEMSLKKDTMHTSNSRIDVRHFPKCNCIYVQENVDREELGTSIGKLYERAAREKLTLAGEHFVKYEGLLKYDGEFTMQTCLPVCEAGEGLENTCCEGYAECMHVHFTEGFSKVKDAHIMMKEYAERNKIICTGTVIEVYHKDMTVDVYMVIA